MVTNQDMSEINSCIRDIIDDEVSKQPCKEDKVSSLKGDRFVLNERKKSRLIHIKFFYFYK